MVVASELKAASASPKAVSISDNGSATPLRGKCSLPEMPLDHARRAAEVFLTGDFTANPDAFDARDVQRVRDWPEWHVGRFYDADKCSPDDTAASLAANLRWRKDYGINDLVESDFPAEFFQTGGMFVGGRDLTGARMIIMRIKMNRSCTKAFDALLERYVAWIFNRVDLECAYDGYAAGWAVVFDCTGAGVSNVNMDILRFIVSSLTTHFPSSVAYVMGYNLPWILNSVWKVVRSWLPVEHQERVKFTTTKEVRQGTISSAEQWPVVCDSDWGQWNCGSIRRAPPSTLPAVAMAQERMGVTKESELSKIRVHFEKLLQIQD